MLFWKYAEIVDVDALRRDRSFNLSICFTPEIRVRGVYLFFLLKLFIPSMFFCNLEAIFNALQCFLIHMLACSDGLRHCSSAARRHHKHVLSSLRWTMPFLLLEIHSKRRGRRRVWRRLSDVLLFKGIAHTNASHVHIVHSQRKKGKKRVPRLLDDSWLHPPGFRFTK